MRASFKLNSIQVIVLMALHTPAPNTSGEEVLILWTGRLWPGDFGGRYE